MKTSDIAQSQPNQESSFSPEDKSNEMGEDMFFNITQQFSHQCFENGSLLVPVAVGSDNKTLMMGNEVSNIFFLYQQYL